MSFLKAIIAVGIAAAITLSGRADSLVMAEYLPKAQATSQTNGFHSLLKYDVTGTSGGTTFGHLTAYASKYLFTDISGAQSWQFNAAKTDILKIDIDLSRSSTGQVNFLNTTNNKLSVVDSTGAALFLSNHVLAFEFSAGQFKILWQKDGGSAAMGSPLPFIGAIINPSQTYDTSLANSFAPITANTDVFMTPVPTAGMGGGVLLVGLAGLARRRANAERRV